MRKIFDFVKTHWLLGLLVLTVLLVGINKILKPKSLENPTVSPATPTKIADYKSIVPGETTLDEVNNLLGYPVKKTGEGDKTTAEYNSSNKYRNNKITLQNEVATLIKEMVNTPDNKKAQDIINEFGIAPYKFYKQKPSSTFDLYVYQANGIAYLGHIDGTLLEIWYFKPTSIDDFKAAWGTGYSTEKPTEILPY